MSGWVTNNIQSDNSHADVTVETQKTHLVGLFEREKREREGGERVFLIDVITSLL